MNTVVVYVHGLWLRGGEAWLLRHRLSHALCCPTYAFSYASMSADAATHTRALGEYLRSIRAAQVHLVGHSLGGVLLARLFESGFVPPAPGRIVLLGAPLRGSRAAQRFVRLPCGSRMLGATAREELLAPRPHHLRIDRDVGVIAGNWPVGLGRLLGSLKAPSDGTVLVEETVVEGVSAAREMRVSHSGLLFSTAVARQTAAFLRDGHFEV